MVTRFEPGAAGVYEELLVLLRERHERDIFSEDGSRIDDQVAQLLAGRRLATAESCTAGLLAARLTERPGSSSYVAGGVVAYANEAKVDLLDVDAALIAEHGAVSEPVAEAMADGALDRFDADTAVAITGIAGPDGGTEEKPVGTVCWSVKTSDGRALTRTVRLPGDRADIRDRSTTVAMHMLRRVLAADAPAGPGRRRAGSARALVSGPRARLFLALDLPEDARARLADWRDVALGSRSDVRPVAPEALHVTLVFLGWQDESARPRGSRRPPSARFPQGRLRGSRPRMSAPCRRATRACSRSTWTTRTAARRSSRGGSPRQWRRAAGTAPRSAPSGRTSRSRA